MKRALVLGGGALMGSYDAGVVSELSRSLSADYFQTIYVASVGVFQGLFYASNQPDVIEDTWRERVDGRKLISCFKPINGRHVLDLDYLVEIFCGASRLHLENVFCSGRNFVCVLTDFQTGQPIYFRPSIADIWDAARGTCALPGIYPAVMVGDRKVIDGGLSDAFPLGKALTGGYDEIVAVYNKPKGYKCGYLQGIATTAISKLLPPHLRTLALTMDERRITTENLFCQPTVTLIRPSRALPLKSLVDTDKYRLNASFDLGVSDARKFFVSYPPP